MQQVGRWTNASLAFSLYEKKDARNKEKFVHLFRDKRVLVMLVNADKFLQVGLEIARHPLQWPSKEKITLKLFEALLFPLPYQLSLPSINVLP